MPIGCEALENRDAEGSFGAGNAEVTVGGPGVVSPLKNRDEMYRGVFFYIIKVVPRINRPFVKK